MGRGSKLRGRWKRLYINVYSKLSRYGDLYNEPPQFLAKRIVDYLRKHIDDPDTIDVEEIDPINPWWSVYKIVARGGAPYRRLWKEGGLRQEELNFLEGKGMWDMLFSMIEERIEERPELAKKRVIKRLTHSFKKKKYSELDRMLGK